MKDHFYILSITVDGANAWSMGPFDTRDDALRFESERDELIGDLVTDLTDEARKGDSDPGYWPDVDVAVQLINDWKIWSERI